MTVDDIKAAIKHIADCDGDPEAQHGLEDKLMVEVLTTIAHGRAKDPQHLALAALEVTKLTFPRWYA